MRDQIDSNKRRTMLGLLGAAGISGFSGAEGAPDPHFAFLAPPVLRSLTRQRERIDVHAHFFNASDVTIEGYLEGPVAHAAKEFGWLVKRLAKLADHLGALAITAKAELARLPLVEEKLRRASASSHREISDLLQVEVDEERDRISREFDALTRSSQAGMEFRKAYTEAIAQESTRRGTPAATAVREIGPRSLAEAMAANEATDVRSLMRRGKSDDGFYAERLLGFVGYMLSSRWTNLRSYRKAFSDDRGAFGITRVLGALVNFDRWLDGKVRSPHEDQLRLHAELSKRSSGYMQPLMSYNPWTDIAEKGLALELVEQAYRSGFVGVKIYPPNGFHTYGNARFQDQTGRPTGAQLDATLEKFWLKCLALDLPVMSHAGASMGGDDAHDILGGPEDVDALLSAGFWPANASPRMNLGHFGGDADHENSTAGKNWPEEFAALMSRHPRGANVYADLGYWNDPASAKPRLKTVLASHGRIAAERVMFGTDWLMLSKEPKWRKYPARLLKVIDDIAPGDTEKIFSLNAKKCFPRVR